MICAVVGYLTAYFVTFYLMIHLHRISSLVDATHGFTALDQNQGKEEQYSKNILFTRFIKESEVGKFRKYTNQHSVQQK